MDTPNNPQQTNLLALLARAPIFTGVGLAEQKMIADKCTIEQYQAEELIIEQGAVGDKLYIIIKGSVDVSVKTQSMGWKHVNTLNSGDVFGEIAILRRVPRTARIKTLTNCQFLTIDAKNFLAVYQYFPPQARDNIQLVIAKRLQELGVFVRL